jgi:hypothetical protein
MPCQWKLSIAVCVPKEGWFRFRAWCTALRKLSQVCGSQSHAPDHLIVNELRPGRESSLSPIMANFTAPLHQGTTPDQQCRTTSGGARVMADQHASVPADAPSADALSKKAARQRSTGASQIDDSAHRRSFHQGHHNTGPPCDAALAAGFDDCASMPLHTRLEPCLVSQQSSILLSECLK